MEYEILEELCDQSMVYAGLYECLTCSNIVKRQSRTDDEIQEHRWQ